MLRSLPLAAIILNLYDSLSAFPRSWSLLSYLANLSSAFPNLGESSAESIIVSPWLRRFAMFVSNLLLFREKSVHQVSPFLSEEYSCSTNVSYPCLVSIILSAVFARSSWDSGLRADQISWVIANSWVTLGDIVVWHISGSPEVVFTGTSLKSALARTGPAMNEWISTLFNYLLVTSNLINVNM